MRRSHERNPESNRQTVKKKAVDGKSTAFGGVYVNGFLRNSLVKVFSLHEIYKKGL